MRQLENIVKAVQSDEAFVVATVVDVQGSTPGRAGFRMVVFKNKTEGTVGGGAIENQVIAEARKMLVVRQETQLLKFDLSELNMTCGGIVTVFFEPYYRKPSLWIFGAGHIARALVPLLVPTGFRITVVDNREGFAIRERFPFDLQLVTNDYMEAIKEIPHDAYAVIVTHGHAFDEEIISTLVSLSPRLPYIGMIGSRKKATIILDKLSSEHAIDHVYSPIGLNIGGDSPEELAISIAAEIQGIYFGRDHLPHCRVHPVSRRTETV